MAERKLDIPLRDLASRLPGSKNGVVVIPEMPGPIGLPDLVALPITTRLERRLSLSCPPILTLSDARLAAACSTKRPFTLATLSRRLGMDESVARRQLRRLSSSGALIEVSKNLFLRVADLESVGRLYALEAKIDDWSGGLGQALRYGSWADASGVIMDRLPRDPTKAVTQAANLGLGLALGTHWLVRPKIQQLSPAIRLWASEFIVAALINKTYGENQQIAE